MSCPITLAGITRDCKGIGGVKEIYISDRTKVSTLTINGTTEIVTAITMVGGAKFKVYEVRKQIASMTSTATIDDSTGTKFIETMVSVAFGKMTNLKRAEIKALALGDLAVIVKDNANKFWYLGFEHPVTLTEGTASTGTAYGDANQYQVTLQDLSKDFPYEVAANAVAVVL